MANRVCKLIPDHEWDEYCNVEADDHDLFCDEQDQAWDELVECFTDEAWEEWCWERGSYAEQHLAELVEQFAYIWAPQ